MPIRHVVVQGEGVDSIAFRYGFFPLTVWESADNAALREKRADRNILLAGDEVVIPDKVVKRVAAATGRRHVFRRRGVPAMFRLQLLAQGVPRAGIAWTLAVDGVEHRGTTDSNGMIEEFVPPNARHGILAIAGGEPMDLSFGYLDPIDTILGVQQRLDNLGYACAESGVLDDATRAALARFRQAAGLAETEGIDDATRSRLQELHDTPALPPAP
ncbi:MAG TPA: peptidoglycan-binding domain-containing protein [Thermoanaerobaculia bacterium]